ncbi:MAG: hypothetical protein WDZ67_00620 [Patescibacteria group bacterium]
MLLWNLLWWFYERRFQSSFGFTPPRSRDRYAIQSLQPQVNQKLRELAATVAKDKTEMQQIVGFFSQFSPWYFSPLGRLTQKGRELHEMRSLYDKLSALDCAISEADLFDFRIRQREDYL